ncbi:HAD family hydrolase [Halomarina rubra]|uniref:HAD family hydrolase n=1 Tax=Halomarina rubra TaxID=2071873 RepID=A0ABD6AZ44_9EURY|nr:HAD family hydrolase [Halomarina rubra]
MAPSTDYDFWLLDLDGTLIDVEPGYVYSVMDEVGDRMGRSFTERESELLWHGLGGSRDALLRQWGHEPREFWTVFHAVEDPIARAEHSFVYEDAAAFVATVDRPVGLVTHSQQYLADAALETLDIADWFDTVVCCDDELGWKPDPAPVRLAMSNLGVGRGLASGAERGVLVGDGPQDVGAAWNAGLDGIHVERHGHDRRGSCVLGDRRVMRLTELRRVGGDTGVEPEFASD